MSKFPIKFISLVIIVALNASGLLAVGEALAYFSDNEDSSSNNFTAGTLDFSLPTVPDFSPELEQGQTISTRTINVNDDGTLGFQYWAKVEGAIGGLCSYLELKDDLSDTYQPLSSFVSNSTTFFNKSTWTFTAETSSTDESLQGAVCDFKLVFEAWQEGVDNYGDGGFMDTEEIENRVIMGYWNPPVVLNEFLPNAGNYDEFVELYNKTANPIDLTGFYIKTNSSTILIDSNTTAEYSSGTTTIAGNSWLVVTAGGDKIGNDSDKITLYDNNDIEVDSHEYDARDHNINNTPGRTNNLVAYLPFDNNTGAGDISGNENNGSFNGDATIVSAGKINQALLLDGDGDYVSVVNDDFFDFGSEEFSIESWFKTSNSSRQWLLTRYENYGPGWGMGTENSHSLGYIRTIESGSDKTEIEGIINVSDNAWHHLVMVRTGDKIKIYTDGNFEKEGTLSGNVNNNEPVEIGRISWSSGSQYFNGLIDEVKIYNRALDLAEIEQHYNDVATSTSSNAVPVDKSYARIPDGIGEWVDPIPTPGAPNKIIEDNQNPEITDVVDSTPIALDVYVNTSSSTPVGITLLGESDNLAFVVTSGASHGELSGLEGAMITYTPESGFIGTDQFTFQAYNSEKHSENAWVYITIGGESDKQSNNEESNNIITDNNIGTETSSGEETGSKEEEVATSTEPAATTTASATPPAAATTTEEVATSTEDIDIASTTTSSTVSDVDFASSTLSDISSSTASTTEEMAVPELIASTTDIIEEAETDIDNGTTTAPEITSLESTDSDATSSSSVGPISEEDSFADSEPESESEPETVIDQPEPEQIEETPKLPEEQASEPEPPAVEDSDSGDDDSTNNDNNDTQESE